MATAQRNDARLELHLQSDIKQIIEQAAHMSGQSVSEFAVSTLLQSATGILEKQQTTQLSDRDRDLLDLDEPPNDALRQAAERYKRRAA